MLIGFHLVIAAHIAHWLITGSTATPVEPSEAMAFSKSGIVNAGLIFFGATILLTAIFGRWFCGWACHLVALQDLSRWLLEKVGIRPRPLRSRLLAWVPAFAFVYMFLWPVAYRIWIGDALGVRGSEMTTSQFWATFPGAVMAVLTFLVCGFACVYFLGAKGFCTYACPYGAVFAAAERVAPLRVRVTDACEGCGHCTAVCTSNVRVHEEVALYKMVVDSGCMKCGDCVSVCPNDALYFGFGPLPIVAAPRAKPAGWARRVLDRGEEAVLGVGFIAGFLAFRGLYGEVPFLMSLGLAGVLAFFALIAWRLVRRPDFAWRHRRLRSAGKLTGVGWGTIGALVLIGLFWLHSGALRLQAALAERDFRATSNLRLRLLDITSPPVMLAAADRRTVERARAGFERIDRWGLFPWRGVASRRAALAYLEGDVGGFRGAARAALARGDNPYEMERLGARAAAENGDLAEARAAGERAISVAPDQPEGYRSLGILLAQAGGLTEAAAVLERGRRHFPRSADLFYDSGVVSAFQNQPVAAIEFFERVLELDPDHAKARENLAGMLASAERFDEAAALYRRAIESSPADVELRILLARSLAGGGRLDEARAELRALLAAAPGHPAATEFLRVLEPELTELN